MIYNWKNERSRNGLEANLELVSLTIISWEDEARAVFMFSKSSTLNNSTYVLIMNQHIYKIFSRLPSKVVTGIICSHI